jgi:hypothetical protein
MKYCICIKNKDKSIFDGREYIPFYSTGGFGGAFMYLQTPEMEIKIFNSLVEVEEYIKRDDPKLFAMNRNNIEIVEANDVLLWYAEQKLRRM